MRVVVAVVLSALITVPMTAQTAPPPSGEPPRLISLSHFIHATNKLETTIAFYRDVFGDDDS